MFVEYNLYIVQHSASSCSSLRKVPAAGWLYDVPSRRWEFIFLELNRWSMYDPMGSIHRVSWEAGLHLKFKPSPLKKIYKIVQRKFKTELR